MSNIIQNKFSRVLSSVKIFALRSYFRCQLDIFTNVRSRLTLTFAQNKIKRNQNTIYEDKSCHHENGCQTYIKESRIMIVMINGVYNLYKRMSVLDLNVHFDSNVNIGSILQGIDLVTVTGDIMPLTSYYLCF